MIYTYRIHRDVWLDIEIEAESESAAEEKYFDMDIGEEFQSGVLCVGEEVAEVWEGEVDEGICIYTIY